MSNVMQHSLLRFVTVSTLCASLSGCAATVGPGRPTYTSRALFVPDPNRANRCPPAHVASDELPSDVADGEPATGLATFSPTVRRTLVATGLARSVSALVEERAAHPTSPTLEALSRQQELAFKLGSLDAALGASVAEAVCVGMQVETVLNDLDDRERSRELALTISSLVLGAVVGTAAGVWDLAQHDSHGPAIVAIAGGANVAAVGVAAFVPRKRRIFLTHERNLLIPIVEGADPQQLFPPFVFRLLTLPAADGGPSPREYLVSRWNERMSAVVEAEGRSKAEALLYGSGGVYDDALLELREQLLDDLTRELENLDRDVASLARAVEPLFGPSAAAPAVTRP